MNGPVQPTTASLRFGATDIGGDGPGVTVAGQDGMRNDAFELRGVNHLALVCRDMARTVEFYTQVLGMPLTKTLDLPGGNGQHFFFDIGNGDSLAFFWFPGAPEAAPGVASAGAVPGSGNITSAHGSMNHIAFDVPLERFEEYRQRLIDKGVEVSEIYDHDDSPRRWRRSSTPVSSCARCTSATPTASSSSSPPGTGAAPRGRRDPRPRRRRGKSCRTRFGLPPRRHRVTPRPAPASASASVGGR